MNFEIFDFSRARPDINKAIELIENAEKNVTAYCIGLDTVSLWRIDAFKEWTCASTWDAKRNEFENLPPSHLKKMQYQYKMLNRTLKIGTLTFKNNYDAVVRFIDIKNYGPLESEFKAAIEADIENPASNRTKKLLDELENCGISLKGSIGVTAKRELKKSIGDEKINKWFNVNYDYRKAYNGEVLSKHLINSIQPSVEWCKAGYYEDGVILDVNALYSYVMHSKSGNKYPVGTYRYIPKPDIERTLFKYASNKNVFYIVTLQCEFMIKRPSAGAPYIPFIHVTNDPVYDPREPLGTSSIEDPDTGEIMRNVTTLTLTHPDYELFIKYYDVTNVEFLDLIVFEECKKGIFDNYINKYLDVKKKIK